MQQLKILTFLENVLTEYSQKAVPSKAEEIEGFISYE